MKTKFITGILLLITGLVSAQTKSGILTYTVPASWQVTKSTPTVVLEKSQLKKTANPCKLEIFQTENTAVSTDKSFLSQVGSKKSAGEIYDANSANRTEANGIICYGIKGTVTISLKPMDCCFYSITNGAETSFIRFIKGEDYCLADFQQFWSALLVDGSGTPVAPGVKKKAATPAAPAPIAPVM